jgi:hypothetical protein
MESRPGQLLQSPAPAGVVRKCPEQHRNTATLQHWPPWSPARKLCRAFLRYAGKIGVRIAAGDANDVLAPAREEAWI